MEPKKIPAALGKQCKACPWKKSVKPLEDIPGGYCVEKHANLRRTIATSPLQVTSAMACHESEVGSEVACVGCGKPTRTRHQHHASTCCFGWSF